MNLFDIVQFIFELFLIYFNLFIVIFTPIITNFDIVNNHFYILYISFIIDLFLVVLGIILQGKISFLNIEIKKYYFLSDTFVLNILFRFIPIISHIGNFISGYNKKINNIKALITLIFGYIVIYIVGNLFINFLGYLFNPTFSTSGIDISYYIGLILMLIGILLLIIYLFLNKNLGKK